ncbi:putative ChrR family anti-sigma factor [Rhizobium sp. WW_1]|jgi:predicted ChrR family anti-sigma factor|nr:putative ChrR family anti-sigma factor [Rhizobium sp. WW_1]
MLARWCWLGPLTAYWVSRMSKKQRVLKIVLTYLGTLPFWLLILASFIAPQFEAQRAFLAYGAIIASFMAGTLWRSALNGRAGESVGGYFIENETVDEADLSQSWESLKAKIDAGQIDNVVPVKKRSATDQTYAEPLRSYIDAAGGLRWRQLGRGAAQMLIPTGDETTTVRLLKIPAGQPVPEHSHRGVELKLVLEGSFSDEVSTF